MSSKTDDGYTFDDLMEGVLLDSELFELDHDCVEKNDSIDGSRYFAVEYEVTNVSSSSFNFSVRVDNDDTGGQTDFPGPLLQPKKKDSSNIFLGWMELPSTMADRDDIELVSECPSYTIGVYRNPTEALANG